MVSYFQIKAGLLAALCLLTPLFCVAQQAPVWVSFQAPDSTATYPQSINDLMVVTGYYTTSWGAGRGFVRYADGTITTFAVPGAQDTRPLSINHAGDITGIYFVPSPPLRDEPAFVTAVPQGFVRTADGTITTFGNAPNGIANEHTTWFEPVAINVAGEVAGNENDALGSKVFTRSPSGAVEEFSLAVGPGVANTTVTAINASGAILGLVQQGLDNWQGFLWSGNDPLPSSTSNTTTPIIAEGSIETAPTAMNAEGTIVGCFWKFDRQLDFVRDQEGTLTELNVPGKPACDPIINDAGTIMGSYTNAANVTSSFIKPLNGELTSFAYPGATATMPTGLNNLNVITGYYSKGATTQGFILVPGNYQHLD